MLIHHEPKTITSTDAGWSGTTWKANTSNRLHGILNQVYVESTTSSTTFKFKLLDYNDRIIYDSNDYEENILNDTDLHIPLKGIYEMQIYDSSIADGFKILLCMQED